ncbi:hypothetical protein T492DRAFT_251730 [Pavlovales sp. CCMP2436]|nr:hypothetical protein T492DRAFT_251730 [Pavlovales sp. CCMP2436]
MSGKQQVEGFNLPAAKELALSKMADSSVAFRATMRQPHADALLRTLAAYAGGHIRRLLARRELEALEADAAQGGGLSVGIDSDDDEHDEAAREAAGVHAEFEDRRSELVAAEEECEVTMRSVGAAYAAVLLRHSSRANQRSEREFFEQLYQFAAEVLRSAFDHRHWLQIDNEISRVFRSGHFNLAARRNAGEKRMIPARELHALRTNRLPSLRPVARPCTLSCRSARPLSPVFIRRRQSSSNARRNSTPPSSTPRAPAPRRPRQNTACQSGQAQPLVSQV